MIQAPLTLDPGIFFSWRINPARIGGLGAKRGLRLFDPPALGEDAHPLVRAIGGQEIAPVVGVGVASGVQHFDGVQNAAPAANEQMAHLFVLGC